MKILILGASRGTGALAVRSALDKGHDVTAFSRSPQKLAIDHPKLTKRAGDFHDAASVEAAVEGHDAVIVTASPSGLAGFKENPTFFSKGTAFAIAAMKKFGVKRLVVLSAIGVGDSRPLLNPIVRFLIADFLLKEPFRDHDRQEAQARESGLDWVIVRPGRLTNGPAHHRYVKKTVIEPLPTSISRPDVAAFMVEACDAEEWVRQTVQIGG